MTVGSEGSKAWADRGLSCPQDAFDSSVLLSQAPA